MNDRISVVGLALMVIGLGCFRPTFADETKTSREPDREPAFPAESNGWRLISAVTQPSLRESSGLAPSGVRPSVIWSHNDGGAGAFLFAIEAATGKVLQMIRVKGAPNFDWEDLFVIRGKRQRLLAVADVGDNEKRRKSGAIYVYRESVEGDRLALEKRRTVRFVYPDGKRFDSEAATFDPESGSVLILTKSKLKTLLFKVRLDAEDSGKPLVAEHVGTLTPPPSFPSKGPIVNIKRGIFGTSCTSADVSPNGKLLAVLTYTDCFLYRRATDESWATAVAREPEVLALPSIYQAEALCFSADGKSLIVSSEKSPTPLYRTDVPPPARGD